MTPVAEAKPGRVRLTRDDVVGAALRLTRDVGLGGLTMRGLADALGVTPMAAYHWVDSKQALIDLVLESVQDEIAAAARSGSWRERLEQLAAASRSVILSYPGVATALLAGPAGPRARALMAEALDLLREAGYRGESLGYAWSTYHSFMLGQFTLAADNGHRRVDRQKGDESTVLSEGGSDRAFAWGLGFLLDALEASAPKRGRGTR
jgi:AcrR family transcriptional regulator